MLKKQNSQVPSMFCWSRFGYEAGQSIEHIIERKEQERLANGGLFLWGIGNALGPSMFELISKTEKPEVIFSPIKSAPRVKDRAPISLAVWTSAKTFQGVFFELPKRSLVTSRYDSTKKTHYALVCFSPSRLKLSIGNDAISAGSLVNLRTSRPVGSSQVTAIVQHDAKRRSGPVYDISMRVGLIFPYLIQLGDPVLLPRTKRTTDWSVLVKSVWQKERLSSYA
jgi:hypothetical protein